MAVPAHVGAMNPPDSVIMSAPQIENEATSEPGKIVSFDGYSAFDDDNQEISTGTSAKRISCCDIVYRVCDWYEDQMGKKPVRTKCFTAGILAAFADFLAQLIENHSNLREDSTGEYDQRRMFAMFVEGFFVSGPLLHYVFEVYEHHFPICLEECTNYDDDLPTNADGFLEPTCTSGRSEWSYPREWNASRRMFLNAFLHVAFDQIFMAFIYVGAIMIVTSFVEGHGDELAEELENDYFTAVKASWIASLGLAPIQFLAFRFLPARYRVLAVNLQDVVWVCIMSYVTHRNREPTYVTDEDLY